MTGNDMEKHRREFLLLWMPYPVLWTIARLDALRPLQSGYKLIVRARLPKTGPVSAASVAT